VLITIVMSGSGAWAFSRVQGGGEQLSEHGGGEQLPEPQIGTFRQRNCDNLERLEVGMSGAQVTAVMGDRKEIQTYNLGQKAEILSNPFRVDTRTGKDGKAREIRYYYAYQTKADMKITTDELCPVVFDDGRLAGWGWAYYEKQIGLAPAGP
jgi:hypothetical protein